MRMGDDMVSLPKRGDRVRVTWAHQHSSLKVGSEVVLSSHGYAVDPANELYRPTPPPDCVSFMYADADHRERGSHAVKVEILERAKTIEELIAASSLGEPDVITAREQAPPEMVERVLRRVDELDRKAEFSRGMRRAVEIARKLEAELDQYDWFSVGELSEAVEKELADD
jgi:hypothetical protein